MGNLIQYGREIAEFDGDSIYDMSWISNRVGTFNSYGSITSNYADCLGYSFDDKGQIFYNYDMIAYCEDGKIIKWIGGDTIAYYEGDIRGAAAAAIVFLFAPKNADEFVTRESAAVSSEQTEKTQITYGTGGGTINRRGARGCSVFLDLIFSMISLVLWYFVFTSSDTALDHKISLVISVIILVCLLLNAFVFRSKDFASIYFSTVIITSIICIIISTFFDNAGYSIVMAFIISLICVPIVIAGLCYIPSLATCLLIKLGNHFLSRRHKG